MNLFSPVQSLLKSLKGRHHQKFLKKCVPLVNQINDIEKEYQSLSTDEFKAKTQEFMGRYEKGETLEDLLPEAFATVKNAARRMCGETISVCDHPIEWQMIHYDVQLIGGIALHERHIAEMATGEGKTLVSTCPLYLNALSGKNCQLVTVNDYLARRILIGWEHCLNFLDLALVVFKIACLRLSVARCTIKILPMGRLQNLVLITFAITVWLPVPTTKFSVIIIFVLLMKQIRF